jgi:hypothetical protein
LEEITGKGVNYLNMINNKIIDLKNVKEVLGNLIFISSTVRHQNIKKKNANL